MDYTFRYSIEVDFQSPFAQELSGYAGSDFGYLDDLLGAFLQLICDTNWPKSGQGEFLDYVVQDVYEFSYAIKAEAEAGRWSVATSLMRPLQERAEYALAAAIDANFRDRYVEYINTQRVKKFTGRSRQLVGAARGIIDRWVRESHQKEGMLESSIALNRTGSEVLHHGIGFSREHEKIVAARPAIREMLSERVHLALATTLLAIQLIDEDDTEAWRRAHATISSN